MFKTIFYIFIYLVLFINYLSATIFDINIFKKYRAEQAYLDKNFKKSIKILKTINEKDMPILYNLGNLFYKIKRYYVSLKYYKKALIFNKKRDKILHNIGNIYFKQQKFEDAIIAYSDSLKIKQNLNTRFNYNLVKTLIKKNKKNQSSEKNKGLKGEKHPTLKKLNTLLIPNHSSHGNYKSKELKRLLSKLDNKRPVKYSMKSNKEESSYANPW